MLRPYDFPVLRPCDSAIVRPYDSPVLHPCDVAWWLDADSLDTLMHHDDPVHVIGHHDELVERDAGLMIGDRTPRPAHGLTKRSQSQVPVDNACQYVKSLMGTDRDEVRAAAPIVVVRKAT